MAHPVRKIINDPVYGFITIDHPVIFQVIAHPYYQRLRRIHQMAFAHLVYPGAVHTRLHHSLGAYHLMCNAIYELRNKGTEITPEEEVAAKVAILLHDIGHGPFSHALENVLIKGVKHEDISLRIIRILNEEMNGALDLAISIFTNQYHKPFLYQLISGQLDVDRMDYLSRDSFFTGVSEGVIGYDRILKMLTVHEGELMVEEKGIYSIEKFLVARRLMYWQVYLHKAVLSAEKMLVRVLERARELILRGETVHAASPVLDLFLQSKDESTPIDKYLKEFCLLDDFDVMASIKNWMFHSDTVLRTLCEGLIDRRLLKVKLQAEPINEAWIEEQRNRICQQTGISSADCHYLLFTGEAVNTTYNPVVERINILFKDGTVKDISQVDNALISQALQTPVKKYYICYLK
ncbi:HD domain-containing protein [Pseudoflavitalea sp. G-6-1-2]|uniref:HD domain-containing protein n=1 Tax=Pseudoflavitalea sp. G-6-1-2 TaxID=2728841 RepID=UPI00146DCC7A|nr:HD domain-containing protein [Pseudoflavitalea sp. G-6-1-2]NML20551.1 HD domain-containing protein [Pseudoflavitalea sp. G-6-1-2]